MVKKKTYTIDLDTVLKNIQKKYGNIIDYANQTYSLEKEEIIPTSSIALNTALGIGGLPRGKIIEIYGPESGGKSTLLYQLFKDSQQQDLVNALIDTERASNDKYLERLGVDTSKLILAKADLAEDTFDIIEDLARIPNIGIIGIDSISAFIPAEEMSKDIGEDSYSKVPKLLSKALKKYNNIISQSKADLVFINQMRANIGAMGNAPKNITTSGKALRYYASLRMEVKRIGQIKQGEEVIGAHTQVHIVKNKVAPPFKKANLDLYYEYGFCNEAEIIDLGVELGLIERNGTWFSTEEVKLGQGKPNAIRFLRENPDLKNELLRKILEPT